VSNTVFENNTAGVYGGAIFSSGDLTITDSILADNVAENAGGGVFILVGSASITDSTIERNSATGLGGGISVQGSGELVLSGTNIISNTSGFGGGGVSGANMLTITDSTISGNMAGDDGGGIDFSFSADREDDVLVIDQTTIVSNTTEADGGGVSASSSRDDETFALVQITDSIISENTSEDDGGGLVSSAPTIIDNTVVMNNTALDDGGGLRSSRALTVMNSTIANNTADDAGGLRNSGTLTMTNSTIANNTATDIAGGLRNEGDATLVNVTISGNMATNGRGGIDNIEGTLTIEQSLLAGNTPQDYADTQPLSTTVTSSGYNLFGVVSDTLTLEATDIRTDDPLLGPLADNNGPTLTRLLRSGSLAIDAVPADQCATTVDQRGTERPQQDGCDIGAVEMLASEIIAPTGPELTSNFTTGQPGSFFTLRATGFPSNTETVLLENGNMLNNQISTDANGDAAIILDTTGATTGTYTITLRTSTVLAQDIEQQVSLELREDAPLRDRETVAGATEVRLTQTTPPADQQVYLPLIRR
jgi:predicted outer membrane repeat protein